MVHFVKALAMWRYSLNVQPELQTISDMQPIVLPSTRNMCQCNFSRWLSAKLILKHVKYALHLSSQSNTMNILLPHRYKKIGAVIAPLGFCLWLVMQLGYIKNLLIIIFGQLDRNYEWSAYHIINIVFAVLGFFSFLAGLYFVSFSKEKIEDEMVQKTRLDSFQFAALLQIIVTIVGFLFILFSGDPGESGMMLFLIVLVFLFWLSFIGRFNYILHVKYKS